MAHKSRASPRTLGASIVVPTTKTTTHIEIKSQPERQTISSTEIIVIFTVLQLYQHAPKLSNLTDNAFSINNLRNYASDPHNFIHHQHKDHLIVAYNIINARDELGYTTYIGKVKSRIAVTHNDEADAGARGFVEGTKTPDITFTTADPPIGGLCTWPQTRTRHPDKISTITKIADLYNGLHKIIKNKPYPKKNSTNTANGHILQNGRVMRTAQIIYSYSNTLYRARRDALEVMCGIHIYRRRRKHGPSLTFTKC